MHILCIISGLRIKTNTLANSVDPRLEMACAELFHQDLHCHPAFNVRLVSLLALIDMFKFIEGRVHFKTIVIGPLRVNDAVILGASPGQGSSVYHSVT